MIKVRLPNGWDPRPYQMPLWSYLQKGGLRAAPVWHRRSGKDDVCLHWTARAAHQKIGNYWHMLPKYAQARKAIWEAINPKTGLRRIDEAFPKELRAQTKEQEMFLRFKCGSTWQVVGSDNYDTLVGTPPIGLVMSEYALSDPRAWGFLSPILAENGGWAIFPFTPRGMNHGKRLYDLAKVDPLWFTELLTVDQTGVFTPETIEQQRRELTELYGQAEAEALVQQEYYVSFEGFTHGAYWSKQIRQARADGRICSVPWQGGYPVFTAWDLGVDDSMTIWFFQPIDREIRVIDYYENTGEGLEHYAKVLKEKPYTYGDHLMPHDIEVMEMTTGKSRKEVAENFGIKPIRTVKRAKDSQAVLNQIEAARNIFSICWFDEKKCYHGISCLEGYRAEYDEEKRKLGDKPEHDWTSHGASAWRTFAVGYEPKKPSRNRQRLPSLYGRDTMESVWMGN